MDHKHKRQIFALCGVFFQKDHLENRLLGFGQVQIVKETHCQHFDCFFNKCKIEL